METVTFKIPAIEALKGLGLVKNTRDKDMRFYVNAIKALDEKFYGKFDEETEARNNSSNLELYVKPRTLAQLAQDKIDKSKKSLKRDIVLVGLLETLMVGTHYAGAYYLNDRPKIIVPVLAGLTVAQTGLYLYTQNKAFDKAKDLLQQEDFIKP